MKLAAPHPRLDWSGRDAAPLPTPYLPPVSEEHSGERTASGPLGQVALDLPLGPPSDDRTADDRTASGCLPSGGPNLVIQGDNLAAMQALLPTHAGRVDLMYADPPFSTGTTFRHRATVGEERHTAAAFHDAFPGGVAGWLDMMHPRLRLMHALLADTGTLYLHLDSTTVHYARVLLDEIFGPECFTRQIIWRIGWISGFKSMARNWIRNHDTLLYYVKTPGRETFHKKYLPHAEGYLRRDGSPSRGKGIPLDDVWNAQAGDVLDSIQIKSLSGEKTGYATQKNEALLERIIEASSAPGQLVADVFAGSGTTPTVAARLGRRFLACDQGEAATALTRRRLLALDPPTPFTVHAPPVEADATCPYDVRRDGAQLIVQAGPKAAPLDQALLDAHYDGSTLRPGVCRLRRRTGEGLDRLRFPLEGMTPVALQLVDVNGRTWRLRR